MSERETALDCLEKAASAVVDARDALLIAEHDYYKPTAYWKQRANEAIRQIQQAKREVTA